MSSDGRSWNGLGGVAAWIEVFYSVTGIVKAGHVKPSIVPLAQGNLIAVLVEEGQAKGKVNSVISLAGSGRVPEGNVGIV